MEILNSFVQNNYIFQNSENLEKRYKILKCDNGYYLARTNSVKTEHDILIKNISYENLHKIEINNTIFNIIPPQDYKAVLEVVQKHEKFINLTLMNKTINRK